MYKHRFSPKKTNLSPLLLKTYFKLICYLTQCFDTNHSIPSYNKAMNIPSNNHNNNNNNNRERYYYFESISAGKVLNASQHPITHGHLVIEENSSSFHQHFAIVHNQLQVMLKNRQSGLFLTIANNSDKNGAAVIQQPQNGQRHQKFRLQQISSGSGEYVIFTFCGKALDVCEDSSKDGTPVIQWDFHGKDNQKWRVKQLLIV